MKKRRVVPVVAAGGILVFLASQFLSLNLGITQSDSSIVDPDAESDQAAQSQTTSETVVSVDDESSMIEDAKLWLVDVLIDGNNYSVRKVTDQPTDTEAERQSMSIEDIVAAVDQAEGDVSGTRLRISRTPEAVASAEKKLAEALDDAGIAPDVVETRQRLVE